MGKGMTHQEIDCRGMACPAPVLAVKKALESGVPFLSVLLDDGAPRENVSRFASTRGYEVSETECGGFWRLTFAGEGLLPPPSEPDRRADSRLSGTFVITSDTFGRGSDELGRLLMKNFIFTLLEADRIPERIFLVNSGVLLAAEGSGVLEAFSSLESLGTEIASCGLCLDYFDLKEKLRSGTTTNMLSIVEALSADNGVTVI